MEEGLRFDRGLLGDRSWLLQCLHHAYLEVLVGPLKNSGQLLYATVVMRVLDIIHINIRHLKDENKWESSGRLDSNGVDNEDLKAAQRNALIVQG